MSLENISNTSETNALKSEVEKILAEVPVFVDENKTLKINIIKDYTERGDVKLLEPLLKNRRTKRAFFKPVLDSFVFNSVQFKEFLEYSSACNSYSKYLGQKIGLYTGDSSLLDRNEVVLNFPFKDCVLEGGQKKEDGLDSYFEYDEKKGEYAEKQSKRREIFYNEVLARDEIDSLFSPKAFCNAKRYEKGKSGAVEPVETTKLNRNAELNKKRGLSEDTITDNLIIKGNNLLALHSLKKEFAGKVKLIYIDPPYNTGSDGFAYNDNFNHSSWLTFMKNRLEIARELLREDGSIWISCDDREFAYLKVLCDEIFYSENFLNDVIWNSTKSVTNTALISVSHTHNLVYFKTKNYYIKNRTEFRLKEDGEGFSNPDNDPRGVWKADPFQVGGWRPNQQYEIVNPKTKVTYRPNEGCSWKNDYEKFKELLNDNRIVFGVGGEAGPQRKRFLFEALERGKVAKTIWDDIDTTTNATQHNKKIFGKIVFNNPKPESLIERIIELSTKSSDIILDYHLGSGTTAAVAHKMNWQYIGVEQMDYIQNVSVERLKKVIEGEQGGISKSQNWQGGGSFVYLELAKKNEKALEQISGCKSLEELAQLFDELCTKYFLHYNVRIKEFRKEIETERFKSLPLEKQKEMFSRLLDLNQLYVNADDRHDKTTGLTKNDIAITEDFYQLKKDGE